MIFVRSVTLAFLALSSPVLAQKAQEASPGTGAVLRALDKVNGATQDLEMPNGATARFADLTVEMGECRYPKDNASGDAFAFVTIRSGEDVTPIFRGWMIASAPALNALDHARYDVWVLRCSTPDAE